MKNEQLITNLNVPLNYVPKYNKITFKDLPITVQRRFIEIVPTPQIIVLRQTCSEFTEETEKIQGDYPIDRFEARILPVSSPIPYNRFRYNRNSNQVEYIAQPGKTAYDPNFLELLNIRSEAGFYDLRADQLHDILERININKVSKVNIRGNIEWEDFQDIMEKPNVRNITLEGSILSDWKFKNFLKYLTNCNYIYIDIRVNSQENFEKLLMEWASKRSKPIFFHMMIHVANQSAECYKIDIFDVHNDKRLYTSISSTSNTSFVSQAVG